MKKSTLAKWIIGTAAITAFVAFTAGVIYELVSIKKLTLDIDSDEEPQATGEEKSTEA